MEKEIQEILDILIICTEEKDCATFKFCDPCKARNLYRAGYRKADEVRKETIGDINQLIKGVEICNSFDTEKEEDTAAFIIDEIKRAIFEYGKKKVDE